MKASPWPPADRLPPARAARLAATAGGLALARRAAWRRARVHTLADRPPSEVSNRSEIERTFEGVHACPACVLLLGLALPVRLGGGP